MNLHTFFMLPTVSIVVPIYKVEDFLHRCIKSIIAQSEKQWELLLIDDGSPDRCGSICDQYASEDQRIKSIHIPNGGVSVARNKGLALAQGTYTLFIDPDDYIAPNMLSCLLQIATDKQCDIVECGYTAFGNSNSIFSHTALSTSNKEILITEFHAKRIAPVVWNKLFRTDFIRKMQFPHNRLHQDCYFTLQCLLQPINYTRIADSLYHYQVHKDLGITATIGVKELREALLLFQFEKNISTHPLISSDAMNRLLGRWFYCAKKRKIPKQTLYHYFLRKRFCKELTHFFLHDSLSFISKVGYLLLLYNCFWVIRLVKRS